MHCSENGKPRLRRGFLHGDRLCNALALARMLA
jgi:hypothetical protein